MLDSGSFRKLSGAAESITVNPDERQLLFSFTGTLVESFSVAETNKLKLISMELDPLQDLLQYQGSGTVKLSGDVFERFVVNNVGFG